MRKIFIGVCGMFLCITTHSAPAQYVLSGGHVVSGYWNTNTAVQNDYSYVATTPELIGYTVYMELGCKLMRQSDGKTSYIFYPGLGISGHCDMINDTECSVEIATQNAQKNWDMNADFLCWGEYNKSWDANAADAHYPN